MNTKLTTLVQTICQSPSKCNISSPPKHKSVYVEHDGEFRFYYNDITRGKWLCGSKLDDSILGYGYELDGWLGWAGISKASASTEQNIKYYTHVF